MTVSYAERGGSKGYQVRVTRNGKQYTRFFSAKQRSAKKQAQEYERQLLEMLGPPTNAGRGKKRPVRTNTGVRYITETTGKCGRPCFRVSFRRESGYWGSRDISIEKHGRTAALKIAKEIRVKLHVEHPAKDVKRKVPSPRTVNRELHV